MINLPPINTDEGLEVRVLLAEVRGPQQAGYNLADATIAMQWMHIILRNRIADPQPFGASDGTLKAVVTARNQFAGFEKYPNMGNNILDSPYSLFAWLGYEVLPTSLRVENPPESIQRTKQWLSC